MNRMVMLVVALVGMMTSTEIVQACSKRDPRISIGNIDGIRWTRPGQIEEIRVTIRNEDVNPPGKSFCPLDMFDVRLSYQGYGDLGVDFTTLLAPGQSDNLSFYVQWNGGGQPGQVDIFTVSASLNPRYSEKQLRSYLPNTADRRLATIY